MLDFVRTGSGLNYFDGCVTTASGQKICTKDKVAPCVEGETYDDGTGHLRIRKCPKPLTPTSGCVVVGGKKVCLKDKSGKSLPVSTQTLRQRITIQNALKSMTAARIAAKLAADKAAKAAADTTNLAAQAVAQAAAQVAIDAAAKAATDAAAAAAAQTVTAYPPSAPSGGGGGGAAPEQPQEEVAPTVVPTEEAALAPVVEESFVSKYKWPIIIATGAVAVYFVTKKKKIAA